MEIEKFSIHCRACSNCFPPDSEVGLWTSSQLRDSSPKDALATLKGCKSLFLFYPNIIAQGPDSFVIVDDKDNPKYVFKVYTKASLEQIEEYKKQMEKFNNDFQDRKVIINDDEYSVIVNEILEVAELPSKKCVVTCSKFIPGQNEYERYMKEVSYDPDVFSYEFPVKEALGVYIDPRNFRASGEERVILITDLKSNIT